MPPGAVYIHIPFCTNKCHYCDFTAYVVKGQPVDEYLSALEREMAMWVRVRMSRRRLTIARRLLEATQSTAMLTTFNEADMSAIMEIRRRRKEWFQKRHDVGLGFMSFFTKAVVGALKEFPLLNAEIQGEEILIKKYYDIGIAVSTDQGLVVPVVRDADRLNFPEIEHRIDTARSRACCR